MENNDLNKLKALLEEFKLKPKRKRREANIFSVGSRNYYENPTTDILAFFLDDTEQHELGSLVLDAIIECLSLKEKLLGGLESYPLREVCTASQNRIDLILEGDSWVIIIENKIYHEAVNPFSDYEKYAEENYKDKEIHYLILSPTGQEASEEAKKNWKAVSYKKLIEKIRRNLGEYNMANPLNKWSVLLREFILHLEDITMSEKEIDKETIEFVYSNLGSISKLEELKRNTLRDFNKAIGAKLNNLCKSIEYWSYHSAMNCYLAKETDRKENSPTLRLFSFEGALKCEILLNVGQEIDAAWLDENDFKSIDRSDIEMLVFSKVFAVKNISVENVAGLMNEALQKLEALSSNENIGIIEA